MLNNRKQRKFLLDNSQYIQDKFKDEALEKVIITKDLTPEQRKIRNEKREIRNKGNKGKKQEKTNEQDKSSQQFQNKNNEKTNSENSSQNLSNGIYDPYMNSTIKNQSVLLSEMSSYDQNDETVRGGILVKSGANQVPMDSQQCE